MVKRIIEDGYISPRKKPHSDIYSEIDGLSSHLFNQDNDELFTEELDDLKSQNLNDVFFDNFECSDFEDEDVDPATVYTVESVDTKSFQCKKLKLKYGDGCSRTCNLSGIWAHSNVNVGTPVRVISKFVAGHADITDDAGYLLVYPDILLSTTVLSYACSCPRRAFFMEKFPGMLTPNTFMLKGTVVHEVFQKATQDKLRSKEEVKAVLDEVLRKESHVKAMCTLNLSKSQLVSDTAEYIDHIVNWLQTYIHRNKPADFHVKKVNDIEDTVWCKTYGIKGKVDLTLTAEIREANKLVEKIIPLELKTGKASHSVEHSAQVQLYSIMLAEIYRSPVEEGLLFYLISQSPRRYKWTHNVFRDLLMRRNDLAFHLGQPLWESDVGPCLPDKSASDRICKDCSYLIPCTLLDKNSADNNGHVVKALREAINTKAAPDHRQYFLRWLWLLEQELLEETKKGFFWTKDSSTREKDQQGLGMMSLRPYLIEGRHVFYREGAGEPPSSVLDQSDYVVVSQEGGRWALASGTISNIDATEVHINLDRDLTLRPEWKQGKFRIDSNSSSFTSKAARNLIYLLEESNDSLKKIVIDKLPPELPAIPDQPTEKNCKELADLNDSQKNAVWTALNTTNYLLIQGMPGTGKTRCVVDMIRLMVRRGHTVLVAAGTNSAVDNILLPLQRHHISIVRLGPVARAPEELKPRALDNLIARHADNPQQLKTVLRGAKVVGTTCTSAHQLQIISQDKFDFCVVDEAAQVVQAMCLSPLFFAKRFILVGDPQQLQPVVRSKKARSNGLAESLFECLNSPATVKLHQQYRMNKVICQLPSRLFYQDQLVCATESVARQTLQLSSAAMLPPDWLTLATSQQLDHSVVFLDVPRVNGCKDTNVIEAELVLQLTWIFQQLGLDCRQMGVATPYSNQVRLITKGLSSTPELLVSTVEQFQGLTKDLMIYSCVRTTKFESNTNDHLQDPRRLNVALTRARSKLIILGSKETLQEYPTFQALFASLYNSNMVVSLPQSHISQLRDLLNCPTFIKGV